MISSNILTCYNNNSWHSHIPHGEHNLVNANAEVNMEERELCQHLREVEQEREQVVEQNPSRARELEGEVQRLLQVIEVVQDRGRALSWRIMLDNNPCYQWKLYAQEISAFLISNTLKKVIFWCTSNDSMTWLECKAWLAAEM